MSESLQNSTLFKAAARSAAPPDGKPTGLQAKHLPAFLANIPPPGGMAADCCVEVAIAVISTLIGAAIISLASRHLKKRAENRYALKIRESLPQLGADGPLVQALDRFEAAESDVERALCLTDLHNKYLESTSKSN